MWHFPLFEFTTKIAIIRRPFYNKWVFFTAKKKKKILNKANTKFNGTIYCNGPKRIAR